jgi:hypothetical protein
MEMSAIEQYRLFNKLIGIALALVFIYPLLFSKLGSHQQIVCVHKVYLGKPCNSCGITHDFKHILKGHYFKDHVLQNVHSIKVFLFFFSAFVSRFLISILIKRFLLKWILILDVIWHSSLAMYAFLGFWN